MERKNIGRRKVEMVKMSKESNLQVTFSKRRGGLFKKASELSTLCGVELAIIVFSPGKKVFSFGHPTVHNIIHRYGSCSKPETSLTSQIIDAHRDANVRQLNMELTEVTDQLEAKRKLGEELTQMSKANQQQYWFQSPIKDLQLSQLQELRSALEKLKNDVDSQKLAILNANPQQFFMGSSSGQGLIRNYMTNNNPMLMFDANIMDRGYAVPPQGYNLNPPLGYGVNPLEKYYNFNLAQGYNVNPVAGYDAYPQLNPAAGYNVNPVEGYDANPQQYSENPAAGYTANPQQYSVNPAVGYNANPQQYSENPAAGYTANPQQYSVNPAVGYNANPQQYSENPAAGYNVNANPQQYSENPAAGYNLNPVEGYSVNPVAGYGIGPAEGYSANPQGNDILQTPGFGGGYSANPLENDILHASGSGGGYSANPQDSEILSLLGFGGGIF